jgi:hypothetical protein
MGATLYGGGEIMKVKGQSDHEKMKINCHRCNGRMAFEKFYGEENIFFGWHCVMCGEILDPVILLHRLSQNADITIPDNEEEVMSLIKKFLPSRQKNNNNINPS